MSHAAYAREIIARGSKSFAAASRLLPGEVRDDVARLYAWCRTADDLIDGQVMGHGERRVPDPAERLDGLRRATDDALAGRATDPVFDGFGAVAARHGISSGLAHDHLDGFAMDVEMRAYATEAELAAYCYGVAGSVGVMMALVLGVAADDADTLDRASDLGLAFQMTNIARDVVADARTGRVYLPSDALAAGGVSASADAVGDPANAAAVWRVADGLVRSADRYYASAGVGIDRLSFRTAWAIASARSIYRSIGVRRRRGGPARLGQRVGTGSAAKISMLAASALTAAVGRTPAAAASRDGLWTRPPRP
ncbi:phytoene/squalene synthase family protein [Acuticoccus sp.]|uniref:phytoene/squalene synthase family protein n=1 Tax=Acuticoccus sp. TaxID=1904378 RepID=UPI003B51A632